MKPSDRGDRLVRQLLATPECAQDIANELLIELNRGYPVSAIAPLLRHPNGEVVEVGAWLASEMPGRLGPIVDQASGLLAHERPPVRFFGIDVVLDNVGENGQLVAAVLGLINDPHDGVRWKVMRFVMLADDAQLRAAEAFVDTGIQAALRLSGLVCEGGGDADREQKVLVGLSATDSVLRRCAAATAARLGSETLLEVATRSDDGDVSTFAGRELSRLRRFGRS